MNSKFAKNLRKLARQVTDTPTTYNTETNKRFAPVQNEDGTIGIEQREVEGTVTVNPECTRGVYRRLKKQAKANA